MVDSSNQAKKTAKTNRYWIALIIAIIAPVVSGIILVLVTPVLQNCCVPHTPSPSASPPTPTLQTTYLDAAGLSPQYLMEKCAQNKYEDGAVFSVRLVDSPHAEQAQALRLHVSWQTLSANSFAGCVIELTPEVVAQAQMSSELKLIVWGEEGNEGFKIGLKDKAEEEPQIPKRAGAEPATLVIRLSDFARDRFQLVELESIVINFEYPGGEAITDTVIYIAEIGFASNTPSP